MNEDLKLLLTQEQVREILNGKRELTAEQRIFFLHFINSMLLIGMMGKGLSQETVGRGYRLFNY